MKYLTYIKARSSRVWHLNLFGAGRRGSGGALGRRWCSARRPLAALPDLPAQPGRQPARSLRSLAGRAGRIRACVRTAGAEVPPAQCISHACVCWKASNIKLGQGHAGFDVLTKYRTA